MRNCEVDIDAILFAVLGACFIFVAPIFFFGIWIVVVESIPETSGRFDMTGQFVRIRVTGSLRSGGGPAWNTTSFMVIATDQEARRVDSKYDYWQRKSLPFPVEGHPGYMYIGREATGNWCGPLPEPGTLVRIRSFGYVRTVSITDLETGQVYRRSPPCEPFRRY